LDRKNYQFKAMNTLYDILGIGRQATQAQIDTAYKERLNALKAEENTNPKDGINRLRVIREAYLQLSSPTRRQSYDAILKTKETVQYEVVDKKPVPWVPLILVCIVLSTGGLYLYKSKIEKERLIQLQLQADKAKAEAEKAAQLAAAEQAALERDVLLKRQQEETANRRLSEQARYEGQRIHAELQQASQQTIRDKERREQQAKADEARSQQEAQMRSHNEIARMERALSIPIRRH
jgi:curved DNA-binding protein CbpA